MPASRPVWTHLAAALTVLFGLWIASPALAQQINPTTSAVQEQQLLEQLRKIEGRVSIPDAKSGVLIQPAGGEWRALHDGTLIWATAAAVLGMLAVLLLFYMVRGRIMIDAGLSGLKILRFNSLERLVHWITALCFMVLAISGLNVTFGRFVLMPLIGADAFAAFSQYAKVAHNFLAFPFMVGLFLMLVIWIVDNIPNSRDIAWFKAGGGLLGKEHPPAGKFNGGQKMIFWMVIIGGGMLSASGLMLMFPFWGTSIADMQLAHVVHALISAGLIAVMLAHIYIGSIGMQGAFDAMGSGEVDLNWAREHHSLWVEQERARGRAPQAPPHAVAAE